MSDNEPVPEGWTELDHQPQVVDKYDPRQPSLFEYQDGLSLQVVPAVEGRTGSDESRWRVDLIEGDPAAPDETTALAEREGRSEALAFAHEAMGRYGEGASVDDLREGTAR